MTSRLPLRPHTNLQYKDWTIPKMVSGCYFLLAKIARERGTKIPQTPVSMTISEVLLDSAIYDEPRSFIPERWLDPDEASLRHLNTNFVAFGRGTRACQGQGQVWPCSHLVYMIQH
jgi:hypothetical protein